MLENVLVLLISNLVEIIHVELSDEGGEITMPEVDGQDFFLKAINIKDGKVCSFFIPDDDHLVAVVLNRIEITYRISKVLEMKIEGPFIFSRRHLPLRRSSFHSLLGGLLLVFFYSSHISKVRLI